MWLRRYGWSCYGLSGQRAKAARRAAKSRDLLADEDAEPEDPPPKRSRKESAASGEVDWSSDEVFFMNITNNNDG